MNLRQYARAQWDRVGAGTLFVVGGLALVLGWIGVSREALTALQVPYIISGGLGGIFLLGLGAVLWLSADLRDEWRKLDAIERSLTVTNDASEAGRQDQPPKVEEGPRSPRRRPVRASA